MRKTRDDNLSMYDKLILSGGKLKAFLKNAVHFFPRKSRFILQAKKRINGKTNKRNNKLAREIK